jgi:hypothetical protein
MKTILASIVAGALVLAAPPANADIADQLSSYTGYTIVASKRIERWVSSDQKQKGDGFEGCEYGRSIIFSDGTYLDCSSYGYMYAYGARALILSNGSNVIMIVRDRVFRMSS